MLVLSDFCLRILCVLSEGGLYGLGGSDRQVTKLLFEKVWHAVTCLTACCCCVFLKLYSVPFESDQMPIGFIKVLLKKYSQIVSQ